LVIARGIFLLGLLVALTFGSGASVGHSTEYSLSVQTAALAPNAGGQEAWSLRFSSGNTREYSVFANNYLRTGKYPLFGGLYSMRFPILGRGSPVQSFAQIGIGASSAGPMAEVLWNLTPLWLLRIDFATHFYFIPTRVIVWNYPFWIGATLPF
jgi:hypothetical protein